MIGTLRKIAIYGVIGTVMLATLALAEDLQGTVSGIDEKGIAMIKTKEGKELKAAIPGVKIGDKVDCHLKDGKTSCHKMGAMHK